MATYKPIPVPLENPFDEFGRLLGIQRFPLESNLAYRNRLLAAAANWGSSTKQGLVNGISAELGLRWYNAEDRAFFFLQSQPILVHPDTGDSLSFSVEVGGVTYSDYDLTGSITNAYKLWRLNDGTSSRILELKQLALTNQKIKVRYYRYEDGVLHLWTDESLDKDDKRFVGLSGEAPASEDIEIYELMDTDFQNAYLIDSIGLPTATFKAIVQELHSIYPILWGEWVWGNSYWDVADDNYSGVEHLPSIFDLSKVGLTPSLYESGIGYGTDLSPVSIKTFSNDSQLVELSLGYFYIRDTEYYLFGNKCTAPVGDFFVTNSPVIVTLDPGGDENYSTPFGRTWRPGSTDKLRQTIDLSGSYVYIPTIDTEPHDPWFSVDISGTLTFSGSYTIGDVSLEYDSGGNFICPIDFNPMHSANRSNRFLGICESPISAEYLSLTYLDIYSKRATDAGYDGLTTTGSDIYPDQDISIRMDVTDHRGAPVTQPDTFVRLLAIYNGSTVATNDCYLLDDGSSMYTFSGLSNRAAVSAKDFIISGQVWQGGSNTGISYEINVPLGVTL